MRSYRRTTAKEVVILAEIEVADDPPAQNQRLERDAAHSRREKLIDDRVGLKVGPPEIPFLHRRQPVDHLLDSEIPSECLAVLEIFAPRDGAQGAAVALILDRAQGVEHTIVALRQARIGSRQCCRVGVRKMGGALARGLASRFSPAKRSSFSLSKACGRRTTRAGSIPSRPAAERLSVLVMHTAAALRYVTAHMRPSSVSWNGMWRIVPCS